MNRGRSSGPGKLAAYARAGGEGFDPDPDEAVLYLGAAEGSRAGRIAARVPQASVVAVEKSPVAALGLVEQAQVTGNLVPYVGDARRPASYAPLVPELGVLFQDVAQPDQVEIFLDNAARFSPDVGYLVVKARSVAVDEPPEDVFEQARARVEEQATVTEIVRLEPYHEDHAMIVAAFEGA